MIFVKFTQTLKSNLRINADCIINIQIVNIQGGKKNLSVAKYVQRIFFFHCILLIIEIKLFQGTIDRKSNSSLEKWQKSFLTI